MAILKRHVFIKKNLKIIRTMIKNGDISSRLMNEYDIYSIYLSETGSKMQRYQNTADRVRCSTRTVERAVKIMEENVIIK